MSWLAPGFLAAGAVAALAVVALHLLAWRRPPAAPLPTARFVPDAPARARARSTRPADPWLLALRVLALLLASAALARPIRVPARVPLARVVIVDRSASAHDAIAVAQAARAVWRPGDRIVMLDSVARLFAAPDSVGRSLAAATGRLSAALVAARDAARGLAESADSVELVLVSPLVREEVDAATRPLAAAWGGRLRLARVAPASVPAAATMPVVVDAPADDPVAAGALASSVRTRAEVRLVRRAAVAADSAWLRAAAGRVLVAWPIAVVPADACARALAWGDDALIAPMAADDTPAAGRPLLRWADGAVAATERAVGQGCVREVRVALPRAGDVTLSTGFARLLAHVAAPCGGARDLAPVDPASLGFRTTGAARVLPRPAPRDPWEVARWLLGAAIVLLLAEPLLRRGATADGSASAGDRAHAPARAGAA